MSKASFARKTEKPQTSNLRNEVPAHSVYIASTQTVRSVQEELERNLDQIITADNIMKILLVKEENWTSISNYITGVNGKKKNLTRQRNRNR